MHELQALLPYHHRFFRGGGVFRREALPELRGGGRPAPAGGIGPGAEHHRIRRLHLSGIRRRYKGGGRQRSREGEGHPQARHQRRTEAGGLPHPPYGHGKSPGDLLRHPAVSLPKRRGADLRPGMPGSGAGGRRVPGRRDLRRQDRSGDRSGQDHRGHRPPGRRLAGVAVRRA